MLCKLHESIKELKIIIENGMIKIGDETYMMHPDKSYVFTLYKNSSIKFGINNYNNKELNEYKDLCNAISIVPYKNAICYLGKKEIDLLKKYDYDFSKVKIIAVNEDSYFRYV